METIKVRRLKVVIEEAIEPLPEGVDRDEYFDSLILSELDYVTLDERLALVSLDDSLNESNYVTKAIDILHFEEGNSKHDY